MTLCLSMQFIGLYTPLQCKNRISTKNAISHFFWYHVMFPWQQCHLTALDDYGASVCKISTNAFRWLHVFGSPPSSHWSHKICHQPATLRRHCIQVELCKYPGPRHQLAQSISVQDFSEINGGGFQSGIQCMVLLPGLHTIYPLVRGPICSFLKPSQLLGERTAWLPFPSI